MVNAARKPALPLSLAGEGWGEGVSATGHSRGEEPSPAATLRVSASPASQAGEAKKRQLAAAVVTVSRWRFMTILLSAPR